MLLHHAQTKIKQPLCVCTRELSDGWARVDCASRASKKAPQGLFCRRDGWRRPMLFESTHYDSLDMFL